MTIMLKNKPRCCHSQSLPQHR